MKTTLCRLCTLLAMLCTANSSWAQSYLFGDDANAIQGTSNATITDSGLALSLSAGPNGSVLNESDNSGLGVDSSALSGAVDDSTSKLNVLDGSLAGQTESVSFSFDKAGVLEELLFDGLKDETLEYFSLTLPSGAVLSLFDFEVELRLNQQSFELTDLGVPSPTQADGASDDFGGLAIRFAAGEVFTLTYGEIDYLNVLPGYDPLLPPGNKFGNGARFEGIVVRVVPEPAAGVLALVSVLSISMTLKRRRS